MDWLLGTVAGLVYCLNNTGILSTAGAIKQEFTQPEIFGIKDENEQNKGSSIEEKKHETKSRRARHQGWLFTTLQVNSRGTIR